MAEANSTDADHTDENNLPQRGRVQQVSQKWRVYEDGVMANQMQNDEFEFKYGLNRSNRQMSRKDTPVAKFVQSEEEERIQQEEYRRREEMNAIAERDAEIARKVQEEEMKKRGNDEERRKRAMEDAAIASQFQQEEMLRKQSETLQREMTDEEYAKYLQEKEKRRYNRKVKERELAKQRKVLQREQEAVTGQLLTGYKMENGGADDSTGSLEREEQQAGDGFPLHLQAARMSMDEADRGMMRTDGRVEDFGDFSDFYIQPSKDMDTKEIQELQELQDEELARLLQDQEHKRGSQIDRQKLAEIEARDAEIAKLLHKQEKLKAKKHHQKHHAKRANTVEEHRTRDAGVNPMDRSHSVDDNNQHNAYLHDHMQQQRQHQHQQLQQLQQRARATAGGEGGGDPQRRPSQQDSYERNRQRLAAGTQQITINPAASSGSEYSSYPPGRPSNGGGNPGAAPGAGPFGGSAGRENPYSTRPLPSPPAPKDEESAAAPGFSTRRDNGNVFSTIDPTLNQPPPLHPHQSPEPRSAPIQDPQYANTGPNRNQGEDGYQDLDELRPQQPQPNAADFAPLPVAGQKRSKSGKNKDKDKCKQQ